MSAKDDMLSGEWYNANFDTLLIAERTFVKDLCLQLNTIRMKDKVGRMELLEKILPHVDVSQVEILSPFMVDYGYNIEIGEGSFFNHNIYLMDCGKITFGKKCFIGPNCGFYTAIHPLEVEERNEGFELAKPIDLCHHLGSVSLMPFCLQLPFE